MKELGFFCLILIWSFSATAQKETEWTLLNQKSGVKVYVNYTNCDQESLVFLRVHNVTGKEVSLSWAERFSMRDRSIDVNSGQLKSLSLAAKSTVEGKCIDNQYLELIVNPNDYVSMAGVGFWELEIHELKVQ
jgi:hypothetical protein